MNHRLSIALILFATLLFAGSARAVDGTIDINQAKVMANGGFPYTIASSGSYRLTSNLILPNGGGNALKLGTSFITLDLNGFTIVGTDFTSTGIGVSNSSVYNVTIKNGTISNFAIGISLNLYSLVENVMTFQNEVSVGQGSIVRNCTISIGSSTGIVCPSGSCVITGNTVLSNQTGIACASDCVITGNTANSNKSNGILCSSGNCTISGNTANSNTSNGIQCDGGSCMISGNTANSNGNTGISSTAGSLVISNVADNNNVFGIQIVAPSNAFANVGNNMTVGNTTADIAGGTSLGAGNTNLCEGSRC